MSLFPACEAASFFNHFLSFVWGKFSEAYPIGLLPIDIHGIGVAIGGASKGGGEALLLGLPVMIGKVKLRGVADPTFEGEGSGNDSPAAVEERAVKAILIELDERGISHDSCFCGKSFEFCHIYSSQVLDFCFSWRSLSAALASALVSLKVRSRRLLKSSNTVTFFMSCSTK